MVYTTDLLFQKDHSICLTTPNIYINLSEKNETQLLMEIEDISLNFITYHFTDYHKKSLLCQTLSFQYELVYSD